MLSPRWRKVSRDLWLHRARAGLVVVAIAVGLAGAGTILTTWALVERATEEGFRASQPASATIRTTAVDGSLLDLIRADPDILVAEGRRTVSASIHSQGMWRRAILFAADDLPGVRIGRLVRDAGRWPIGTNTLAVERSSLGFSGISVGEPVQIAIGDRPARSVAVVGTVRDVGLAPGWMEHVVYGFVSLATLEALGLSGELDEVRFVARNPAADRGTVRQIAYRIKTLIERTGRQVTDVDVPVPGEHIHAAQMNSLLLTQGAFGALALALCGFLVINLVTAMLTGETRQIGVMKTVGGRGDQLAAMYLTFALVLGVAASAIGVPAAIVIGRRYAALKAELLNFEVSGYAIPWWAIGIVVVVGCLLPVIAAAVPVRRASRLSVADALRDVGISAGPPLARDGWLHRLGWLSRPTLLSLRNAFRRRGRMALTLTTLALGGAVYLGAVNLKASIHQSVDVLFARQRYDVVFRLSEPVRLDSLESTVGRVVGVAVAEAWGAGRGALVGGDGTLGDAFPIAGPPVPTALLDTGLVAGRWFTGDETRVLVVSRSLLKAEPRLRVGETVSLAVGAETAAWRVVGVVEAGPTPTAFAPRAALIAGGAGPASMLMVATDLDAFGVQIDLIQRIRGELGNHGIAVATSQRLAENRRVLEDHLLMVADFLAVMGWVMIAVGGMGLASTMSLAVLERTREIGVLKAIGAPHGAIARLVETEGVVVGIISWFLAIPLSIPMSVILAKAFSRVMLEVPIHYFPLAGGVFQWLVLVIVVSLVASGWPAYRAMRVPTRVALAYD